MNRYGIDDINLANCTDHKTLTNNKKSYDNSGILIKQENCIYSFAENWDYLHDLFSRFISEEYGLWLQYLAKNDFSKNHTYKAEELRNNILYLEDLIEKKSKIYSTKRS